MLRWIGRQVPVQQPRSRRGPPHHGKPASVLAERCLPNILSQLSRARNALGAAQVPQAPTRAILRQQPLPVWANDDGVRANIRVMLNDLVWPMSAGGGHLIHVNAGIQELFQPLAAGNRWLPDSRIPPALAATRIRRRCL